MLKNLPYICIVFLFCLNNRYDLRVRYIPVNFLEKFKKDRSTFLYFYQQVCILIIFFIIFIINMLNVKSIVFAVNIFHLQKSFPIE